MGNPIQFDFTILVALFPLIVLLFVVYLMSSALRFMKHKAKTDKELLQKLDELIRLQVQQSDKENLANARRH